MQRYNQRLIEELKNKQTQERARLPKIQRSDAKTRMAMFKKSLRITATGAITPDQERERIKQVPSTNVALSFVLVTYRSDKWYCSWLTATPRISPVQLVHQIIKSFMWVVSGQLFYILH